MVKMITILAQPQLFTVDVKQEIETKQNFMSTVFNPFPGN